MIIFVFFLVAVMVSHFFGDFIFQTEHMAIHKAHSLEVLFSHAATYGITLLLFTTILSLYGIVPAGLVAAWVVLNTLAHFLTDMYTSRVNGILNKKYGMTHWFFVGIGFDQMIHMITLIVSSVFLFPGLF